MGGTLDDPDENDDTVAARRGRRGQGATTKACQRHVEEEQRRHRRSRSSTPNRHFRPGHLGTGTSHAGLRLAWALAVGSMAWAGAGCTDATTPATGDGGADAGDVFVPPIADMMNVPLAEMGTGDLAVFDLGVDPDPCDPNPCGPGETCAAVGGEAECTPNDCATLECGPTEACEPVPEGGARCVDASCDGDLSCPADQYCDGVCVPDVCLPGARTCADAVVEECAENGSGALGAFVCGSPAEGYESVCAEDVPGEAACGCRDAWDCPEYQACVGGRCRGTGNAPTCRLDPVPFEESLPAPEFVWGGTAAEPLAVGSPFPESNQAVMTPVVANLDDDNGDGLIDERDFPEIIFMTFCNSVFASEGTLRAVRGGGPNKGADAFAVHGPHVWRFGEPLPEPGSYDCVEGDIDPTASLAVGDLDDPATSDGRPEIVVVHHGVDADDNGRVNGGERNRGGVVIYDNTGARIAEGFLGQNNRAGGNPAAAIANVDGQGMAEIVVGPYVMTLERAEDGTLSFVDSFAGALGRGINGQGAISCLADVLGDGRPEIVAGSTVYALPEPPPGATRTADCVENGGAIEPAGEEPTAWCAGELVVRWNGPDVNPDAGVAQEGFCAVADVFGAADAPPGPGNPLDGVPEVLVITNGRLAVYDGPSGRLRDLRDVSGRDGDDRGGAPNVDDFDGDGFPEVGSAFELGYEMVDFQPPTAACPAWPARFVDGADPPEANPARDPGGDCAAADDCAPGAVCGGDGRCVCLHNGWRRATEDDSSRVTGSTLFDFNGDGAAEVIYNDECWFRIYDGRSGRVLFKEPSESRTRIEHPIVADVDNDGNAEIAFTVSNESGFCSERDDPAPPPFEGALANTYNNGLEVWGDPADRWVSARRIWNQHAYHVTQVAESGAVPLLEPRGWEDYNGRSYNTYRSQPRSFGVAPDLTVAAVQFTSPDAACGTLSETLELSARIANVGDLRVGPGVIVAFEGLWGEQRRRLTGPDGQPIAVALVESLEPRASTRVGALYDITANGDDPDRLPDRIEVIVDADGDPEFGLERECREDNNRRDAAIVAPDPLPDLRIADLEAFARICPEADFHATVTNASEIDADGVVVRFYAGDPERGGASFGEVDLGTVAAGETREVDLEIDDFPPGRQVVVYAVVDPDGRIEECSDGDNTARAEAAVSCTIP